MSQTIKFSKMHALGNDFMVVEHQAGLDKINIEKLANRHTGIGFDQLLVIEKLDYVDFRCRIFNADGTEAEQCGNGLRCVSRYVVENHLTDKKNITIETKAGISEVSIPNFTFISIKMGVPTLEHQLIKIQLNTLEKEENIDFDLSVVSLGNPHAIVMKQSLENLPIGKWGKMIGNSSLFPQGVNVGFAKIIDREHLQLLTYERGVGPTLACGSNACAAVVAGIWNNLLNKKITVHLPLGNLLIEWNGKKEPVTMTGPADFVFSGEIKL